MGANVHVVPASVLCPLVDAQSRAFHVYTLVQCQACVCYMHP